MTTRRIRCGALHGVFSKIKAQLRHEREHKKIKANDTHFTAHIYIYTKNPDITHHITNFATYKEHYDYLVDLLYVSPHIFGCWSNPFSDIAFIFKNKRYIYYEVEKYVIPDLANIVISYLAYVCFAMEYLPEDTSHIPDEYRIRKLDERINYRFD